MDPSYLDIDFKFEQLDLDFEPHQAFQ